MASSPVPDAEQAARDRMADVFIDIYRKNAWGDSASVSGPGSTVARAAAFIDDLVALLHEYKIRSLLDAPCGDGQWIGPVADAVERYVGLDIVPELIAELNRRPKAGPQRRYGVGDLTRDPLPTVDLILCRDCLVHFSFADVARAVANMKRSGSRYLLTTTFEDREQNPEIETGAWRPLNFCAAPFHLPEPVATVDEKCLHTGGIYRDKRLGLWPLESVVVPRLT
ncbi:MAG: class I SAM-dependent methyltransferase [Acidobacteriota bacterium]